MSKHSLPGSSSRAASLWTVAMLAAAALLSGVWYAVFLLAPVEAQMGIVQKIFYVHVPSAYAMYLGFTVCAVASAGYLWRRRDAWDAWAVAGAEVGLLFCAIVLLTGPLWARKAWGVWWTWDPRLTTTLLAGMIFAAYLSLRSLGVAGEAEKRFAAGLAIVGLGNLPIIHISVKRWRGQHPTVITGKGGGLDGDMRTALLWAFLAFTVWAALLLWHRARLERTRQQLLEAQYEGVHR